MNLLIRALMDGGARRGFDLKRWGRSPRPKFFLLDASADHYLTIEDAVTAGTILMEKLVGDR